MLHCKEVKKMEVIKNYYEELKEIYGITQENAREVKEFIEEVKRLTENISLVIKELKET